MSRKYNRNFFQEKKFMEQILNNFDFNDETFTTGDENRQVTSSGPFQLLNVAIPFFLWAVRLPFSAIFSNKIRCFELVALFARKERSLPHEQLIYLFELTSGRYLSSRAGGRHRIVLLNRIILCNNFVNSQSHA